MLRRSRPRTSSLNLLMTPPRPWNVSIVTNWYEMKFAALGSVFVDLIFARGCGKACVEVQGIVNTDFTVNTYMRTRVDIVLLAGFHDTRRPMRAKGVRNPTGVPSDLLMCTIIPSLSAQCTCAKLTGFAIMALATKGRHTGKDRSGSSSIPFSISVSSSSMPSPVSTHERQHPRKMSPISFFRFPTSPCIRESFPGIRPGFLTTGSYVSRFDVRTHDRGYQY